MKFTNPLNPIFQVEFNRTMSFLKKAVFSTGKNIRVINRRTRKVINAVKNKRKKQKKTFRQGFASQDYKYLPNDTRLSPFQLRFSFSLHHFLHVKDPE